MYSTNGKKRSIKGEQSSFWNMLLGIYWCWQQQAKLVDAIDEPLQYTLRSVLQYSDWTCCKRPVSNLRKERLYVSYTRHINVTCRNWRKINFTSIPDTSHYVDFVVKSVWLRHPAYFVDVLIHQYWCVFINDGITIHPCNHGAVNTEKTLLIGLRLMQRIRPIPRPNGLVIRLSVYTGHRAPWQKPIQNRSLSYILPWYAN